MKRYTQQEVQYLVDNHSKLSREILAKTLNITVRALEIKFGRLGLSLNAVKWETINCLFCNKEVKCLKKENRKYCSHSCSATSTNPNKLQSCRTQEFKDKMRALALIQHSDSGKNILVNNCKVCNKECKKPSHIYCSRECKSVCKKLRVEASNRMKQRFIDNPELHPNRLCAGIKESYPEKMLTDYLNESSLVNNLDYIKQFKLDTYYIDFVFPTLELAIEVDGSYWHNPHSEREIKRQKRVEEEFRLIRFEAKKLVKKEYQEIIDNIIQALLAQK